MGGLRDNMAQVQPGPGTLDQVDDVRRQLMGDSNNALVEWAKEQGIPEPAFEWTVQV